MPCGQYCYQRKWQCQGGRLRQLTNVQKQPGPTRNYGSEGARQNSIRRRVMSVKTTGSKTNYGPLFGGKKKPSVFSNCGFCGDRSVEEGKNVYYNNGGTSGTNTYWNKIAVGPKGVGGMTCCPCEQTVRVSDPGLSFEPGTGVSDWVVGYPVTWGGGSGVISSGLTGGGSMTIKLDNCNQLVPNGSATLTVHRPGGQGPATLAGDWSTIGGPCEKNRLCGGDNGTTLLGGAPCSIGGKQWLNYRRFHPGAAKS